MRELTSAETEHAAGGVAFLLAFVKPLAAGVGFGVGANYAYDKLGGAEGIDKMASAVWDAVVKGATARATTCQKAPLACTPW